MKIILLILVILLLSVNINVYVQNSNYTTKIYCKIFVFSFNIPYQRLINNKKDENKIKELISVFNKRNLVSEIFKRSCILDVYIVKYEPLNNEDVNIYENIIVMNLFYKFSQILNNNCKKVDNEFYNLCYGKNNQIDLYLNLKTNVFSTMISYIVYYFKKGEQ